MKQKKVITTSIKDQKVRVFLAFLLLSFFIWLLIELSKTATSQVIFKVDYVGAITSNIIQNKPIKKVEATVKASGFTLLEFKLKHKKIEFNLADVLKNGKQTYLLPNEQVAKLNSQFSSKIEIVKIHTDTIFIELGIKVEKKIPVKLNEDITYKLGHHLVGGFKLQPDSITVSGGEKYTAKIKEVATELLRMDNVHKNIANNVKLIKLEKNVNYSASEIKVIGEIDKITEGRFVFPVKVINIPKGVKFFPFPKEVEVIYQSGLAHFEQINSKSVDIYFDYNQYRKDTLLQYLTPIVKHKSNLISSLKIEPSQIEFLIQK